MKRNRHHSARAEADRWYSLGETLAPIVKRLTVAGAMRGAIPRSAANRIVGSRWLREA
jgi:hypothetical protein